MNVINARRYTLQTNLKQNARYNLLLTKELNNIVYKYTVPVPIY